MGAENKSLSLVMFGAHILSLMFLCTRFAYFFFFIFPSKLMEFNLALKDCDRCIELDPQFIKGHLRKGHICIALKNYQKACEAFEGARKIDGSNQEAIDGYRQVSGMTMVESENRWVSFFICQSGKLSCQPAIVH